MKIIVLFLSLLLFSNDLSSQERCFPRQTIIDRVKNNINLNMFTLGIMNNGWIIEVIINKDRTWTIIGSSTAGQSCILGSGSNWVYALPIGQQA